MTINVIGIYVPDPTYGQDYDDVDAWDKASASFKADLEAEYQVRFDSAGIGPGVDIPAFVTWFSLGPWPCVAALLTVFFMGKRIKENLDAWKEIYQQLKAFSKHRAVLDRDGAAILAFGEILTRIGGTPSSIRLVGYRALSAMDGPDACNIANLSAIETAPPSYSLGFVIHAFQIEVERGTYRVFIDGSDVSVVEAERDESGRR